MNRKNYYLWVLALAVFAIYNTASAQLSITTFSPVTETLTGFAGASTPANWSIAGTGTRGTTWNGNNQTGGTSGGWYGNASMSFLGSGSASAGNATWCLHNNTGSDISGFTLSYVARVWRSGSASPAVSVSWSKSSAFTVPAAGGLTALSSLGFTKATAGVLTGTTLTQTVTGINIAAGEYIFIRFIHAGGSSSDNSGWDDISFSPVSATAPLITVAALPIEFGAVVVGDSSANSSYTISANNLTDDVKVVASSGFKLSVNDTNYFDSLLLARNGTDLQGEPVTVYKRFFPLAATGLTTGLITHSSAGATDKTVIVKGHAIAAEPTQGASDITFSNITATSLLLTFNKGNGSNRIVIARQTDTVNFLPTDTVIYTGINANYTSATDRGSLNKIVYSGTDTFVNITGLQSGTYYHFEIVEYNIGTGASVNYDTTHTVVGDTITLPLAITGLSVVNVSTDKIKIRWNKPAGTFQTQWDGVVVFARVANPIDATVQSIEASSFNGNTLLGAGTANANSFCIAKSTSNIDGDVTVTGLSAGNRYYFQAYTYKEIPGMSNDIWSVVSNSIDTEARVQDVNTFEPLSGIDASVPVSWVSNDGAGDYWNEVFVFASKNSIGFAPTGNGTLYNVSDYYGHAAGIVEPEVYLVYKGAGDNFTLDSVLNDTTYYIKTFTRLGSAWSVGVEKTAKPGGATKLWDGGATTTAWADAANWSPDGIPTMTDFVLLDNKFVSGNYQVLMPAGTVATKIDRLVINPTTGSVINLNLPVTNTLKDSGLQIMNPEDAMMIFNGGVFTNSSVGVTAGDGFLTAGSIKIFNGGKFIHNNARAFTDITTKISKVGGTEKGIFEIDMTGTSSSFVLPAIAYGTLVLKRSVNTTALTYSSSGNQDMIIRGDLELVGSHIRYVSTIGSIAGTPRTISIGGNLTNAGIFQWSPSQLASHTLVFNGTTQQEISGAGTFTFGTNLATVEINNPTGVKLNRALAFNGPDVKLTNGKITLGNNNLTLSGNSEIYSADSTRYIVTNGSGTLIQSMSANTSKDFPIGTTTAYLPLNLVQYASSVTDNFTARVEDKVRVTDTASAFIANDVVDATWYVGEGVVGGSLMDIMFQWTASKELAGFDRNNSYVGAYQNYVWTSDGNRQATGNGLFGLTSDSITAAGVFGVGSGSSPLPVKLIGFDAIRLSNKMVKLSWVTAEEINSEAFIIERSEDSKLFIAIGKVKSRGNSNDVTNYSFTDVDATQGKLYYRLKQVDFNGTFSYSDIKVVTQENKSTQGIHASIYPNPSAGISKLLYTTSEQGAAQISIFNVQGVLLAAINCESVDSGNHTEALPQLSNGIYFIKVVHNNQSEIIKLVVN